ncbi:hypothetical protein Tco_0463166 [Tanacetum coccineum]
MCNYLKNMEGYKLKDLKLKYFNAIQEMFDRAFKRVNIFEDYRTELLEGEGKSKRAGAELMQESLKKKKVDDNIKIAELKQLMKIIPDEEEVAIDVIPLAMYMIFSQMLKSFDREDLEDLYKLAKAKYEPTRPVEDLDLLLWGDLKTMFEPSREDDVWRQQQGYKVLNWKLYDSCGVHSLMLQFVQIYMLVENQYPLTPPTLSQMLEKKLIIDYESEMAYQLEFDPLKWHQSLLRSCDKEERDQDSAHMPFSSSSSDSKVSNDSTCSKSCLETVKLLIFQNEQLLKEFKKSELMVLGNPHIDLQDQGVIDSGCTKHMTGNISYHTDYEEIDGGYVAFGGNPKGGKIPGKEPKSSHDDGSKPSSDDGKKVDEDQREESECNAQEKEDSVNS